MQFIYDPQGLSLQGNALTLAVIDAAQNTISNLQLTNFASGVLVTSLSAAQQDDTTVASAKAVQDYIGSVVSGANHFRGTLDLTNGAYPLATTGSGAGGTVVAGDWWRVTVAGAFGTASAPTTTANYIEVGDVVTALTAYDLTSSEGLTNADFLVTQGNMVEASVSEAEAKTSAKFLTARAVINFARYKSLSITTDGTATSFLANHQLGKGLETLSIQCWHTPTATGIPSLVVPGFQLSTTVDLLNDFNVITGTTPFPAGTLTVNITSL